MSDLAGLTDVTDSTSPRVAISGSGSGKLYQFYSPKTETESRRSQNSFHVLTNGVEPSLEFLSSSTPPGGLQRRIEDSIAKLVRRTTENVPKPS
ncbi:unnamed protein product [Dibothriocephalus latus]|uniref:Uncharacterized protein n=1 Tax=Dibothriocephalus latus TaxID=60516 RepID=A0A3P7KXJ1_DIBLA|nr:unnamed protein product [Dibothriocephalus latus]